MDVFQLDEQLIKDYEDFSRSFTSIKADDIKSQVDDLYREKRFWPDPLISINPRYEDGEKISDLVKSNTLCPETEKVFSINGEPIRLYRHQAQAIAKAKSGQSYVVTTGTGSGKSLCFFIPIIDAIIQAKKQGKEPSTKAIIIYPMNALANSQLGELEKFINSASIPEELKPTFARYTGQESDEERERIKNQKPDILLTNFMMLELLMTRQAEVDKQVILNAHNLEFLVLDELHTYRGRQGADVALLLRRVSERLCPTKQPLCIGTSATMASDDGSASTVASIASKLFGVPILPDSVIDESLQRATSPELTLEKISKELKAAVQDPLPQCLDDNSLKEHPLAIWVELEIGLEDSQRLKRRKPLTVTDASKKLALQTGLEEALCKDKLQEILSLMSLPENERGGSNNKAFLAFKLHQFISGASNIYATLNKPPYRRVTLDGQKFDPKDEAENKSEKSRLYSTFFCRDCGQEFHPVTLLDSNRGREVIPRDIADTPYEDSENAETEAGYLMPDPDKLYDLSLDRYPEEWLEPDKHDGERLKKQKRSFELQELILDSQGYSNITQGQRFLFLPGKFRFCPSCKETVSPHAREVNKLASLSAEGRSSATTLLVSSILRWMNTLDQEQLPLNKRKLLGFSDNRQDAALQAGHFNDFIFVTLLRAATLAAIKQKEDEGLSEESFGSSLQNALGFKENNLSRAKEWMIDPDIKGLGRNDAEKAIRKVLAYRVWTDQRRGWRFTNPNLEQLGLIEARYPYLDKLAEDEDVFSEIRKLPIPFPNHETRKKVLKTIFDAMRKGLALNTEFLEDSNDDLIGNLSRKNLREPWAISKNEKMYTASYLMVEAPKKNIRGVREENLILRAGSQSALGRQLKQNDCGFPSKKEIYTELLLVYLNAAKNYGLVQECQTPFQASGWQLSSQAVQLVIASNHTSNSNNAFFINLYDTLANELLNGGGALFGMESREHTAQVDQVKRQWRENRFRWESKDQAEINKNKSEFLNEEEPTTFLPVMFCSPTMELGVDISALNVVYMRNMPPTPANYAQRSGRAGRSGQAALVISYCASKSPHDQYYFSQPNAMVSGIVRPPALELSNRELIQSHLHAIWLADYGEALPSDIPALLELSEDTLPLKSIYSEGIQQESLRKKAEKSMRGFIERIKPELQDTDAAWVNNLDALVCETAELAPQKFDQSFNRWRELYQAAKIQLSDANRKTELPGIPAKERRDAKREQAQANEQIILLQKGNSSNGSDFYTYRYLATEGFLPGYNFPRLPLYAYVPASTSGKNKASYLQRARFLAIAEFGPNSLIYHEGRAYRVWKAKLPPGSKSEDNSSLATEAVYICNHCGAAHRNEVERCHACHESMAGIIPIRHALRIDNVEARPVERITANDEDRRRQGFDIQTVFSWPSQQSVLQGVAHSDKNDILILDYAAGTTISRINKGLRRRKEKSIVGFGIDPSTGKWLSGPIDGADEETTPEGDIKQRVVPIVQDHKNACLLRLPEGKTLTQEGMTTLQQALARGIELVFQLEEGEVQTEPLPSREERKAILCYEATEGGAGVLSQLINTPNRLAEVAKKALELMHYSESSIEKAIQTKETSHLIDEEDADCVIGCYRCLLSYYNQPDHEMIDRTQDDVLSLLLSLCQAKVQLHEKQQSIVEGQPWLEQFKQWGIPIPDEIKLHDTNDEQLFVWPNYLVAAKTTTFNKAEKEEFKIKGYCLIHLSCKDKVPPQELLDSFGVTV